MSLFSPSGGRVYSGGAWRRCWEVDSQAFSLVEVALALGVVAFCVIAMLGLFSLGWQNARDSIEEFRAGEVASSLLARMRAAPKEDLRPLGFPFGVLTNSGGPLFQIDHSAPVYLKSDGIVAGTQAEAATNRGFAMSGSGNFDTNTRVASVSLTLWWPAGASYSTALGKLSVSTFMDTEVR